jgi:hypothetical protein
MELIGKVAIVGVGIGQNYADGTWHNKAIDKVQEEEGRTIIFTYDTRLDLEDKCTFIRDTLKQSKVAVIIDGQLFEH